MQDVAILKAIGVNRFGTREVLGLSARISEAEVHWYVRYWSDGELWRLRIPARRDTTHRV